MEVAGKRSNSEVTPVCQPCADADDNLPAAKFCAVCKEWLCGNCVEYHRRFRPTRNHTLIDKDEAISTDTEDQGAENGKHYCSAHPTELIKYFLSRTRNHTLW